MATIPTILFYLGLFVMVEIKYSRKCGMKHIHFIRRECVVADKEYWFHFFFADFDRRLHVVRFSPIMSVFWWRPWCQPRTACAAVTIIPWDLLTGKVRWFPVFTFRPDQSPGVGHDRRAGDRGHLRRSRAHCRNGDADWTWPEIQLDRD